MPKTSSDLIQQIISQSRVAVYLIVMAIILILVIYTFPVIELGRSEANVKKVYFADNISVAHQKIIEMFNSRNKGRIEIVPIDLPFTVFNTNERKELIARALRGKNSRIDIFAVDLIWLPRFAKWAEPLDQYIPEEDLDELLPFALTTCQYDGKLVGTPLYIDIGIMYYRDDILRTLPDFTQLKSEIKTSITWEKMLSVHERYFGGQPIYMFQGDGYEGLICNYVEVLGSNGGRIFADGKFQVASPKAQASCQFMVDMIHRYQLTPMEVTNFTENESYRYALSNDIPFFRGWPSFTSNISVFPEDSAKVKNLRIAPLPHFKGHSPASVFGGWNLMIARDSPKKEAAAEFLRFAYSSEAQKILYETGGYMPIRSAVYNDAEFSARNPELKQLQQIMEIGIHRPAHINYTRISDILSNAINEALIGDRPVAEILEGAAELIREIE